MSPAIDKRSHLTMLIAILALTLSITANLRNAEASQSQLELPEVDLTSGPPADQQGQGVPGGRGGTFEPRQYELPLTVAINRVSQKNADSFVLELGIQNTGTTSFDFPISQNISHVQATPGRSRRQFSFAISPVTGGGPQALTVAVTAGSPSVPGSLIHLEPGKSVRVLIRVKSALVSRITPNEKKQVDITVICNELTLDDSRFSVRARSKDINSTSVIRFLTRNGGPVVVQY